jgi:hypothetical protein
VGHRDHPLRANRSPRPLRLGRGEPPDRASPRSRAAGTRPRITWVRPHEPSDDHAAAPAKGRRSARDPGATAGRGHFTSSGGPGGRNPDPRAADHHSGTLPAPSLA